MALSSGTHPIFENVSKEIVSVLATDGSTLAKDFRNRARDLLDEFQRWGSHPPDPATRSRTVQAILDLHREVQEYRAAKRDP
jgi:hypothetical protein